MASGIAWDQTRRTDGALPITEAPAGWQSDPFGIHEARYFSTQGRPTKLVRDGDRESYDNPPIEATISPIEVQSMTTPTDASSTGLDSGNPPPGWYPDPIETGNARRWDGTGWTDDVMPLLQPTATEPSASPAEPVGQHVAPSATAEPGPAIERTCPVCQQPSSVAYDATSMYCGACARQMYFLQCSGCQNIAISNALHGDQWTCPTCYLVQAARLNVAPASGRVALA
jgi:hypothetical protein